MKKLAITAAFALFAAIPVALAQSPPDDHHGGPSRGGAPSHGAPAHAGPPPSAHAPAAHGPAAAAIHGPAPAVRGPAAHAAPAAAPAPPPTRNRGNTANRGFNNNNNANRGANNNNSANRGANTNNASRGARPNYAQYHRNFTAPRRYHFSGSYHRPAGYYAHRWTFGNFLPRAFFVSQYWIDDFGLYGLLPPPPGTVWVRYGDDALLIDEYTGEVIQVEYNIFF